MDLCAVLGVPTPGSTTNEYIFEQDTQIVGAARGYADVFMRDHFAWENKAPGANLDQALKQLLGYTLALDNPPLLVVCDRLTIRIHTQFNGHPSEVHTVALTEIAQPDKQQLLRRLWTDPESFRPKKTTRDITEAAAQSFAALAEGLRKRGNSADQVAHFLTQCLFCFFAEDVDLLPGHMFQRLVNNRQIMSKQLGVGLSSLFKAMRDGGMFGADEIPWFNGGLFKKIAVPELTVLDVTELRNAADLNWSAIDVSIFGTLFERGLDPAKRKQLGAHYTDPATILRIVEPVVQRPLLIAWADVAKTIGACMARSVKRNDKGHKDGQRAFIAWLDYLSRYRLLDPACGSGNFLFMGLKALKDIEHKTHLDAVALGLEREQDLVTGPFNVLGIEVNEFAAELARVTVWIGELQWRLQHGYAFKTNPVLEPLDNIECRDALIRKQVEGDKWSEASWPKASVVIGNPPFLGGGKKRGELGDEYFTALDDVYKGSVPGFADLVCYWFAKSLKAIENNGLTAAGLVSTNSIRGGANRKVLDAIADRGRIFTSWSDEAWVNEGAAVRVSLICFGGKDAHPGAAQLDGIDVAAINSSLRADLGFDPSLIKKLPESSDTAFEGTKKYGKFEVDGAVARQWLQSPNPHGESNAAVVRPWANGGDVTSRRGDDWIIDFGTSRTEAEAALFELPYRHVLALVKPKRTDAMWWLHERTRPQMRAKLAPLRRFILTVRHSKYRLFVWQEAPAIPDTANIAIARADDATFGILHSRFHELWSLRMCSWLGVGNDPRYTPSTCFDTFPFPAGLAPIDTSDQETEQIAGGALVPAGMAPTSRPFAVDIARSSKVFDTLRSNWLNPPEWTVRQAEVVPLGMAASPYPDRILPKSGFESQVRARTLTGLYNERPPWLDAAHFDLDSTVAKAYGWSDYTSTMPDDEILRRLLALNLARNSAAA